uniref:Uncharacterized protein n=1 Tax=Sphaerodactylus townsendi TaxID=933632 RepID=A0ACB8FJI1_9SAUR
MPRGEKLLSSEEDSEGSQRSQENLGRAASHQRSEPSRRNEKARKMVDGSSAAPSNSPTHSGVPSQDCLMAQTEQEEASNPEESDGPVAALQSSGLVSKDGRGQIKDMQDRRSDQFCKRTHEATAMAIRALATASIVSRASIVWARKVLELIPPTETKAIEGVNRMLKAANFVADATLDAVTFLPRSLASSVATRQLLWLRAWQTNWRSKTMVSECAFHGHKLFGEELNEFLVDPKEKPKHLPKQAHGLDKKPSSQSFFRPQQSTSQFKRDNFRRPYWNQGRQQFKKGFTSKKGSFPDRYQQDNQQPKA